MRYFGIGIAILVIAVLFINLPDDNPGAVRQNLIELEIISAENAPQLEEIAHIGNGILTDALAYDPVTNTIATGGMSGIRLYEYDDFESSPRFIDTGEQIYEIVFLKEGQYLAYSSVSGVHVIDLDSEAQIMHFPDSMTMAKYPDDSYLLVYTRIIEQGEYYSSYTPVFEIWDIEEQSIIQEIVPADMSLDMSYLIPQIAISPDGRYVSAWVSGPVEDTCGHRNSFVIVVDSYDSNPEAFYLNGAEYLAFSPDSQWSVSAEWNSWGPDIATLHLLELETLESQIIETVERDSNYWGHVTWFGFNQQNGQLMALTDGVLRSWTIPEQEQIQKVNLNTGIDRLLVIDESHSLSITDSRLSLWNENFEQEQVFPYEFTFQNIQFLDSGNGYYSLDESRRLHIYRLTHNFIFDEVYVSEALPETANPLLSRDGNYLAYVDETMIHVVDTHNGNIVSSIESTAHPIRFSEDESRILISETSNLEDYLIRKKFIIYDIATNQIAGEFEVVSQYQAASAQVNLDGSQIAISSKLDEVYAYQIYSVDSGDLVSNYETGQTTGHWTPDLDTLIIQTWGGLGSSAVQILSTANYAENGSYVYRGNGSTGEISEDSEHFSYITSSHTGCGGDQRSLYVHSSLLK